MDAISVTVRRGGAVEAVHRVHVRSTAGDAYGEDFHCFFRSSLKPVQAIPLLEGYEDLGDDELAIASASHQAEPAQLEAARKLLARAGASVDDLENGLQEGRPDGKLGHNCSGKHAGMLAACRAHGWPLHPYRSLDHPLQQRVAELVGDAEVGVDGCGVPTFALPLSRMCAVFLQAPQRIREAMAARPELVGGEGSADTELMRALPGWFAKGGAEGLFCVSDGTDAWTFKVEDGAFRGLRPAVAHVLGLEEFREVEVRNSRGEVVGSIS
ncbi:MAG TPA: asparaginase [Gaiellaceae bacterium]|nr:asparaginase [Gaiellaceae bacterium]